MVLYRQEQHFSFTGTCLWKILLGKKIIFTFTRGNFILCYAGNVGCDRWANHIHHLGGCCYLGPTYRPQQHPCYGRPYCFPFATFLSALSCLLSLATVMDFSCRWYWALLFFLTLFGKKTMSENMGWSLCVLGFFLP